MKAWINGELLLDRGGIAWQTKGGTPVIDTLFYSSFYGGGNPGWAPSKPTYARFKDVCFAPVVDGYSGIDPDNGRIVVDPNMLDDGLFNDETNSNGAELPEWLRLRGELSGETEEAAFLIKFASEEVFVPALFHYSNAVANLNQATSALELVDASSLGENPVDSAANAIRDLDSAISFNTASAEELEQLPPIQDFIHEATLKMPELAIMVAESAQDDYGCFDVNAAEQVCLESISLSDQAKFALESSTTSPNDRESSLWYSENAWNLSVEAIIALD